MELRRGTAQNYTLYETAKIRSRIFPAGDLGVPPPDIINPPGLGD